MLLILRPVQIPREAGTDIELFFWKIFSFILQPSSLFFFFFSIAQNCVTHPGYSRMQWQCLPLCIRVQSTTIENTVNSAKCSIQVLYIITTESTKLCTIIPKCNHVTTV